MGTVTVSETALELGCSEKTLRRYIRIAEIPNDRGNFPEDDVVRLRELIEQCSMPGCSQVRLHYVRGIGPYCAEHNLHAAQRRGRAAARVRKSENRLPPNKHGHARYLTDKGYVNVYNLEAGEVTVEHRNVMELKLGRKLCEGESVHHLNGIQHDNRPENLELWVKTQLAGQRVEDLVTFVAANYWAEVCAARVHLETFA